MEPQAVAPFLAPQGRKQATVGFRAHTFVERLGDRGQRLASQRRDMGAGRPPPLASHARLGVAPLAGLGRTAGIEGPLTSQGALPHEGAINIGSTGWSSKLLSASCISVGNEALRVVTTLFHVGRPGNLQATFSPPEKTFFQDLGVC